ncbi:hypothetical protein DXG03_005555 [Asterophora parasitica]|uniref:Uncharacterized protein n=1 Tax=Asterophora parasitica TaxID=117018 RepID=A0A9P7K7I0_9AGAR|nr:hypothetical protein DXG03_005555 [Asterophora parasitica]
MESTLKSTSHRSSGLGLATAQDLLSGGASVAILDLKPWPTSLSSEQDNAKVLFVATDIREVAQIEGAVQRVVEWTRETGAALGGVINSAGLGRNELLINAKGKPHGTDVWDLTLGVNVAGTFHLTRLALEHLVRVKPEDTPDGERGVIILIASEAAVRNAFLSLHKRESDAPQNAQFEGQPGQTVYAASKGAVRSMALPMARDLARHHVRVVCIAPGPFTTPLTGSLSTRVRDRLTDAAVLYPKRFGTPGEFAKTVRWALECAYVNGETIRLTGATEDGKKEKRRRELAGKLGKEMNDRRDDGRHYHETISALHANALQLSTRPETLALYSLRLLPLTLERGALLAQAETEERHGMDCAQIAYDEERERVDDEWRRGRERVRERLLEGIEERRRRAREEKEGEGTSGDAAMDVSSRPHITRKLRNKLGTSPPPTPLGGATALPQPGLISSLPITSGPFLNPHSLSVDELPSPFPLPLTSTTVPAAPQGGAGTGGGGRRRPKGNGAGQQAVGGLGKSLAIINPTAPKESEVENDLNDIRRGNKRRRATAVALGKMAV